MRAMTRGKTPLTESVRQAAKQLAHADRPATVILVSGGGVGGK